MDGGWGLESHFFADLPHRRGIPVLSLEGDDKFINLLLLGESAFMAGPSCSIRLLPAPMRENLNSLSGAILSLPPQNANVRL